MLFGSSSSRKCVTVGKTQHEDLAVLTHPFFGHPCAVDCHRWFLMVRSEHLSTRYHVPTHWLARSDHRHPVPRFLYMSNNKRLFFPVVVSCHLSRNVYSVTTDILFQRSSAQTKLLLSGKCEYLTPSRAACLKGLSGANKREVSCSTVHCIRPGPVAGRPKIPPGACLSSSITRTPALPA